MDVRPNLAAGKELKQRECKSIAHGVEVHVGDDCAQRFKAQPNRAHALPQERENLQSMTMTLNDR